MRNTVNRLALVLLLASVFAIRAQDHTVRAQTSDLPSTWTVDVYGDTTQFIIPRSINNKGVVTAQLQTQDGYFPVELSGGQVIALGDGSTEGTAAAINDEGVVVGTNIYPDGSSMAVVYAPGSVTELNSGAAFDIDDSGTIVGVVNNVAAYWPEGGAPLALPPLLDGRIAEVYAINENGWMVGDAVGPHWDSTRTDLLADHAVLWRDGQITDLGSIVPGNTIAIDVNDAGTIIAETNTAPDSSTYQLSPFTWQDGTLNALPFAEGDTNCEVYAINNSGWIAGDCGTGDAQHAVLWVDGQIVEIDTLLGDGWQSVAATDVNDNGQIIGQGRLNGVMTMFMLTPAG